MTDISIDALHTTLLGSERIRRNLELKTNDVVGWCRAAVSNADKNSILLRGKNWYVYGNGYVITINRHSHTIITAHKQVKK